MFLYCLGKKVLENLEKKSLLLVFCSVKRNALSFVATRTRAGTNRALVGHSKTSYVNLNNITSGGFIA